jgi:hypothetical protein
MNEVREAASVDTAAARGVTCHPCGSHYKTSEWQHLVGVLTALPRLLEVFAANPLTPWHVR